MTHTKDNIVGAIFTNSGNKYLVSRPIGDDRMMIAHAKPPYFDITSYDISDVIRNLSSGTWCYEFHLPTPEPSYEIY